MRLSWNIFINLSRPFDIMYLNSKIALPCACCFISVNFNKIICWKYSFTFDIQAQKKTQNNDNKNSSFDMILDFIRLILQNLAKLEKLEKFV